MGLMDKTRFPAPVINCGGPDEACRLCKFFVERRVFKARHRDEVYLISINPKKVFYFNNHNEDPVVGPSANICISAIECLEDALSADSFPIYS